MPPELFSLWAKATDRDEAAMASLGVPKGANVGTVVAAFAAAIPRLWPDWDKAPAVPAIGDVVTLDFGKRKGKDVGTVTKVRGTKVTARFSREGLISFAADMLED